MVYQPPLPRASLLGISGRDLMPGRTLPPMPRRNCRVGVPSCRRMPLPGDPLASPRIKYWPVKVRIFNDRFYWDFVRFYELPDDNTRKHSASDVIGICIQYVSAAVLLVCFQIPLAGTGNRDFIRTAKFVSVGLCLAIISFDLFHALQILIT